MDPSVATGLFTLGGVALGYLPAVLRDRAADLRSLRDQRAARVREAFFPVLRQAIVFSNLVRHSKFAPDLEEAHKPFVQVLTELHDAVDVALIRLDLEPGADVSEVRERAVDYLVAFREFQSVDATRRDSETPREARPTVDDLNKAETRLSEAVEGLRAAMQSVMQSSVRPVPLWPHGRFRKG